jgi:type 2A phosphatase activator TIP41
MRVDHTMIRVHDTRFYHEAGTNFILREYSKRENKISELKV